MDLTYHIGKDVTVYAVDKDHGTFSGRKLLAVDEFGLTVSAPEYDPKGKFYDIFIPWRRIKRVDLLKTPPSPDFIAAVKELQHTSQVTATLDKAPTSSTHTVTEPERAQVGDTIRLRNGLEEGTVINVTDVDAVYESSHGGGNVMHGHYTIVKRADENVSRTISELWKETTKRTPKAFTVELKDGEWIDVSSMSEGSVMTTRYITRGPAQVRVVEEGANPEPSTFDLVQMLLKRDEVYVRRLQAGESIAQALLETEKHIKTSHDTIIVVGEC